MKPIKAILLTIGIIFTNLISAQIGINTEKPISDLDVNGNMLIRSGIIKTGNLKDPGKSGQFLQSTGTNTPPKWVDIDVAAPSQGEYKLANSIALHDEVGVVLSSSSGTAPFKKDESISTWTVIKGLTTSFTIDPIDPAHPTVARDNTLSLSLESIVQMNNSGSQSNIWVAYAYGIFVDGKLKATRTSWVISGVSANMFQAFSLMGVVDNLSAGDHLLQVAVKRRNHYHPYGTTINLYAGASHSGFTNTNAFMNKTTLTAELYLKN